jgi:hypothetical protein
MNEMHSQRGHPEKLIGDSPEETPKADKGHPRWRLADMDMVNGTAITVYPIKTAKMAFPGADEVDFGRIADKRDGEHLSLLVCKHLRTVKNKPPAPVIKHGANSLGLVV